jgi:hypothetical protein
MVDTIVSSSNGYRLGALGKWASGVEEPLSTAIGDFPKRGILVGHSFSARLDQFMNTLFSTAQRSSKVGMESRLSYPQQSVAPSMRLG